MLTELPRIFLAAMTLANILWQSIFHTRRFGFEIGKRVFYLRYSLLLKNPAKRRTARPRPAFAKHTPVF